MMNFLKNLFDKSLRGILKVVNVVRNVRRLIKSTYSKPEFDFLYNVLNQIIHNEGSLFFVQIGANDGTSYDPIYKFITNNKKRVSGIAVEPIKLYFEQLQNHYINYPKIKTVNVAIHNTEKEMIVYKVNETKRKQLKLPAWSKGIASFNKSHHLLSDTPVEAMETEKVRCVTLDELLIQNNGYHADLLQIDTEGYDADIILNINFESFKPTIIHFEHGFPNSIMSREKYEEVRKLLHSNGYEIWLDSYDAVAYQPDFMG
jgi:FkbM family methyltransferase